MGFTKADEWQKVKKWVASIGRWAFQKREEGHKSRAGFAASPITWGFDRRADKQCNDRGRFCSMERQYNFSIWRCRAEGQISSPGQTLVLHWSWGNISPRILDVWQCDLYCMWTNPVFDVLQYVGLSHLLICVLLPCRGSSGECGIVWLLFSSTCWSFTSPWPLHILMNPPHGESKASCPLILFLTEWFPPWSVAGVFCTKHVLLETKSRPSHSISLLVWSATNLLSSLLSSEQIYIPRMECILFTSQTSIFKYL